MAQPNVKELIVSGPLAGVSVQYRNRSYIGDLVFPIINTDDPKAKITRYPKGAWFRDEAGIRGPGARAQRSGYPVDLIPYVTHEYAFAKELPDEDRRFVVSQGAPPLQPDIDALEFCADKIDLSKEVRIANLAKGTAWSGQSAGGEDAEGLWAAGSGNTFIVDVLTRIETIRSNTGLKPNVLMMDFGTYNSLKMESTLLDRIKYTEKGIVGADLIAAIFDLEEVIIGETIVNSAKETKAGTEWTAANVWEINAGKGMGFLFYRPRSAGLKTPMAGVQVRIMYEGGSVRRNSTWREPAEHQDVYEVAEETGIIAVGQDLGFMWKDTLLT